MKLAKYILTIILLLFFNIVTSIYNDFSYLNINILAIVIFCYLLLSKNENSIILLAIIAILFDFFSGIPFGITAFAAIITFIAVDWFLNIILTNRSLYTAFFTGLLTFFLFRLIISAELILYNFFVDKIFIFNYAWLAIIGWELLFTSSICFLIYFFFHSSTEF